MKVKIMVIVVIAVSTLLLKGLFTGPEIIEIMQLYKSLFIRNLKELIAFFVLVIIYICLLRSHYYQDYKRRKREDEQEDKKRG